MSFAGDCCASPAGFRACFPGFRARPVLSRHCLLSCAISPPAWPSRFPRVFTGFGPAFGSSSGFRTQVRIFPVFVRLCPVLIRSFSARAQSLPTLVRSLSGQCSAVAQLLPGLCPTCAAVLGSRCRCPMPAGRGLSGSLSGVVSGWGAASGPAPDPAGQNPAGQKKQQAVPSETGRKPVFGNGPGSSVLEATLLKVRSGRCVWESTFGSAEGTLRVRTQAEAAFMVTVFRKRAYLCAGARASAWKATCCGSSECQYFQSCPPGASRYW